jgi:hypothetical protein
LEDLALAAVGDFGGAAAGSALEVAAALSTLIGVRRVPPST